MSNQSAIATATAATSGAPCSPASWNSKKLQTHHLERLAIVYVRQSSPQQVLNNQESTARQYALVDFAVQLGWKADQVVVIDDDQGLTGSTAEGRQGFHRLLAEVSLDNVGIVLGIELSRLARSNKDWHQLIELCGIFRTLLADQDGLYDPTDHNDRLLLGLRGMMSEAEIHILQGRMYEAVLSKARRGELYIWPPVGYVKLSSGEFAIDPDEQVQSVVGLVFDEFDRLGTARRVLRYLQQNDIKLPVRPHSGPNKGSLEWHRATASTVNRMLTHPIYAGTYRHGHRQTDKRRKKPGAPDSGRFVVTPDKYHALIPNHCPAYITPERYERNQQRLKDNSTRPNTKGPPRDGPALLGGIVFCGRCGHRMTVQYPGSSSPGKFRYVCSKGKTDFEVSMCQNLSGPVLDNVVTDKLLQALEPAGLELSLLAADDLEQEHQRLDENWRQRLERSRYDAERAQRQYQAVEPENRLVARELERQWEESLQAQQELEQEYARHRQAHSNSLSDEQRQLVRSLSDDLPAVWNASTTKTSDRKRIVRLLVERVVVTMQGSTEHVDVSLNWSGGLTSQHEFVRPVAKYEQMADYDRLLSRLEDLGNQGLTCAEIAEHLHQEGFRPAQGTGRIHKNTVSHLFQKLRRKRPGARRAPSTARLQENEWFVSDLATTLEMPKVTLATWIRRGWVHVVRQLPGYCGEIVCWADEQELSRLRSLRQTKHGWWKPPPDELVSPKHPTD